MLLTYTVECPKAYTLSPSIHTYTFWQELDGADQLLLSEHSHLLSLKKSLESVLSRVQSQLQELSKARARLYAAIQERSRVTDLLCQSMMSSGGPGSKLATPRQRTARPSSGSSTGRSRTGLPHLQSGRMSMSHANMNFAPHHAKSFSAPVPMTFAPANSTGQPGSVEGEENGSRRPTPPRSARPGSTDAEPVQPGIGNIHFYDIYTKNSTHTAQYIWPKTKYICWRYYFFACSLASLHVCTFKYCSKDCNLLYYVQCHNNYYNYELLINVYFQRDCPLRLSSP